MWFGNYGLKGFIGDHHERTKRAWLCWARWTGGNLTAFHRVGVDPAKVEAPGSLCPVCFGGSIYVRLGSKDSWMRGIALCRVCHAPVLIQKRQEKKRERVKELVLVRPEGPRWFGALDDMPEPPKGVT